MVHVYAVTDPPVLLMARRLYPHDPAIEAHADDDRNLVDVMLEAGALLGSAVVLVAYDGDTGERWPGPDRHHIVAPGN